MRYAILNRKTEKVVVAFTMQISSNIVVIVVGCGARICISNDLDCVVFAHK